MSKTVKTYEKEGLVVRWEPDKCIHSAVCFKGLPNVFDPRKRPWVNVDGAARQEIADQVRRCPSGALSIEKDEMT